MMDWKRIDRRAHRANTGLTALGALVLAFTLTIAGCASTGGGAGSRASVGDDGRLSSDCILSRTIRDFSALDNSNLILDGPGSRAYHVVLATPSFSLESEYTIGLIDRDGDGRICPYGRDRVLIDGPLTEQVSIRSIEQISEDQVEGLRVRFGLEEAATADSVTVTEVE